MQLGTLASIWRYPVKSLAGESLASVAVDASGLPSDRTAALFVRDGHARVGKEYRGKEHERLHLTAGVDAARGLAADRGVELEYRDGARFFDLAPISIILDRWLRELSEHVGYRVEYQRFRPNFFVRAEPDYEGGEADLVGRELTLGALRVCVRKPIERCVVPTYDLHGGASDPRILRFLAQERNAWMGIYCDVLEPATVRQGDALSLAGTV